MQSVERKLALHRAYFIPFTKEYYKLLYLRILPQQFIQRAFFQWFLGLIVLLSSFYSLGAISTL